MLITPYNSITAFTEAWSTIVEATVEWVSKEKRREGAKEGHKTKGKLKKKKERLKRRIVGRKRKWK